MFIESVMPSKHLILCWIGITDSVDTTVTGRFWYGVFFLAGRAQGNEEADGGIED